jgi:hypothetical protein
VILGDSLTYVGSPSPRYSITYSSSLSLLRGFVSFTADFAYDGEQAQIQRTYDGWGAQDLRAPLPEQAHARIATLTGNRQSFSALRFNAASAQVVLPSSWTRALRAQSASVTWRASNLGLWSQYRGRDPAVNALPASGFPEGALGEGTGDDGFVLPPPRTHALLVQLTF